MAEGKIRTSQHITGDRAVKIIKDRILPPEWVVREMTPDYGIDLDVELFDYENDKCVTLGEHIFVQAKGTEFPTYGKYRFDDSEIDVIKYVLETSELNLVNRMGSAFPVLLILVDLNENKAYQICLNDYINKVLPTQNPNYRKQDKVTIHIPIENSISSDNLDVFRWYGKRVKIYSMFHEMLADIEDISYMMPEDAIKRGTCFIEHYSTYDVVNNTSFWYGMEKLRKDFDIMTDNDGILPEAISHVQKITDPETDLESADVYVLDDEYPINAYVFAKNYSLKLIFEEIKNLSGIFETCCREWFMPGVFFGVNGRID